MLNIISIALIFFISYAIVPILGDDQTIEEKYTLQITIAYIAICLLPQCIYAYRVGRNQLAIAKNRDVCNNVQAQLANDISVQLIAIGTQLDDISSHVLSDSQLLLFNEFRQRYRELLKLSSSAYLTNQVLADVDNLSVDVIHFGIHLSNNITQNADVKPIIPNDVRNS